MGSLDGIELPLYADHTCSPSGSTLSPDTPASKGGLGSNFVDEFVGCRYFIAPVQFDQGLPELAVFSLSQSDGMVSCLDERSLFYYIDPYFGATVSFTIGNLRYQWNTVLNTLSQHLRTESSESSVPGLDWLDVELYTNFEEAKAHVAQPLFNHLAMLAEPELESSPPTDSNTSTPPNTAEAPSILARPNLLELPSGTGFFGPSPTKEKIDLWVDHPVDTHQAAREGTKLKCPETGCNHAPRRPSALK
ncbi:hypothetical protein FRC11_012842, partial [Ceratobasidium sp. 423]